jgi:hypothetical protein
MKAALFLLLALGAASVPACEIYSYCHCVNSDESSDNTATDAICTYLVAENSVGSISPGTASDGGDECDYGNSGFYGYDNCLWRVYCKIKGATGADSSCRELSN